LNGLKMKKVLMIVTSQSTMGDSGKQTGIWAEELTTPYYALIDAGYQVVLASPLGGKPPLADGSYKLDATQNEGSVKRFFADAVATTAFANTAKTAELKATDFDAVFLPGGHGTMWDTASDLATAKLVGDIFQANKPVAAVCHGPAGLVKATRADGKSILLGKRVNGFTNDEETGAGLMDVVPFHLETTMRELGGVFENGPMWQPYAVRDGNLVTGQNPASSALVAKHFIEALA
jgi:putative intracellular protease/amidase